MEEENGQLDKKKKPITVENFNSHPTRVILSGYPVFFSIATQPFSIITKTTLLIPYKPPSTKNNSIFNENPQNTVYLLCNPH